jgi:predicted O-linked N-acetylglucosamine transferase (SPINDLY family)
MENNRILTFALKPAPIQVCWLAYPGTTGLTTIDYRLTDPYLDPPGLFDSCYSEKSFQLPNTFWCYDPLTSEPQVAPLPALKNGYVTFGSLNNYCKNSIQTVKLWAKLLNIVEQSRLIVLAEKGIQSQQLLDLFEKEGVRRDRIDCVGFRPRRHYLETFNSIDIGLDTLPANGHTTSLDAYWMGVPVVTLVGNTVAGRAGLSQLTNLGLPGLISITPEEYIATAASLSRDLEFLSHLRTSLRSQLQGSSLMDAREFTRGIESAYRSMWGQWCAAH